MRHAHDQTAAGERIAGPHTTSAATVASTPSNAPRTPERLTFNYGEAARAAGVSARTIWAACASGDLRAARIGRRRLIPRDELVRWINAKAGIVAAALDPQGKDGAR